MLGSRAFALRLFALASTLAPILITGCTDQETQPGGTQEIRVSSGGAVVSVTLDPFSFRVVNSAGTVLLESSSGDGAYAGATATVDTPYTLAKPLPGWDTYSPGEAPFRSASHGTVLSQSASSLKVALKGDGIDGTFTIDTDGDRVKLAFSATGHDDQNNPLNKASLGFKLDGTEHFFGLGERFATMNHRGWSLYSWAEEGALGEGETTPVSDQNPYPNGPSMTYFPVPFYLSSKGYGVHLTTTYRTETHFGSEVPDAYRVAVNAANLSMTVYAQKSPVDILSAYTQDTGRPPVPASWAFGPRRRVNVNAMVGNTEEVVLMRQKKIPITAVDDAVHFLPALSQLGQEDTLSKWTSHVHDLGYKAMCYNNPYVASDNPNATADYQYGLDHGYFVKLPDGKPAFTQFISGKLLTLATIDLSNPDAVTWFQSLLQRSLDLGYDGWMHDFGEYIPREAVLFDGRRGDEFHNAFPVLSAKAAHDLLEKQRPGNYLYFVRSGGSGTQAYVPAVWGGDAEATFDETQGLPSVVRGGLNLAMAGVPYWGSDMTGFKCLTSAPHDKEVFFRWVEFGATNPIMMEQDACSNPVKPQTKWKLWNDDETIAMYRKYALLHTRLSPYFDVLAQAAHDTGRPILLHPFVLHPDDPKVLDVEDAYYVGPSLYVSPVVRRGVTVKKTYLPQGRYVEWDTLAVAEGGQSVDTDAPLDVLPMWLVEGQMVPLLDPSIDTLAPEKDPTIVSPGDVADVLDVRVALGAGQTASLVLADGTKLSAQRLASDQGNPANLTTAAAEADLSTCEGCYLAAPEGDVLRLRATTKKAQDSDVTVSDVRLQASGPSARRIRWDVLRTK
jgi:alpha-glucosidase (family GH31 glycosyl hydrolase)